MLYEEKIKEVKEYLKEEENQNITIKEIRNKHEIDNFMYNTEIIDLMAYLVGLNLPFEFNDDGTILI